MRSATFDVSSSATVASKFIVPPNLSLPFPVTSISL